MGVKCVSIFSMFSNLNILMTLPAQVSDRCPILYYVFRFGLLSDHLLGNSCSPGRPYVLFVF